MEFIDLKVQQAEIKSELERRITDVLEHGRYIMGPEVKELEERLQEYTNAKHCITVASGTDALLISLMTLGIGPGDEVITTPFTFVSTVEVIINVGARPVFVDIDQDTYNIDAFKIENKITTNTKAIIPVSLYGQPADMDEINVIAAKHGNIPVIEDAAQSFGAEYKGKKSCNLSTIGCTSFFPSKPLGCYGDGGAIFSNDDEIAQACREIRVHGQSKRYVHTRVGISGRMDTLQCAIVLAKLGRFDWEIKRRCQVAERYTKLINESCELITTPRVLAGCTSVFGQYTILTRQREQLQASLKAAGIPTAIHYPVSLNEQPAYKKYDQSTMPITKQVAEQVLSLPMGADLSQDDQDLIIRGLAQK